MNGAFFTYWLGACSLLGSFFVGYCLAAARSPSFGTIGGLVFVGLTVVIMYLQKTRDDND